MEAPRATSLQCGMVFALICLTAITVTLFIDGVGLIIYDFPKQKNIYPKQKDSY
jgi:hypothetical protein